MAKMKAEKEMEEIKKSLNYMSGELSTVAKQQTMLLELVDEVKKLQALVKEKDAKIAGLERRIDDLEQYSRMEDVIISGMSIKPRSYAKAAAVDGGETEERSLVDQQTITEQVIQFFESKRIQMDPQSIVACHTLPRKDRNPKPAIIVHFGNRKQKADLLKQGKKLKGSDVYVNEHLTNRNAEIAREARMLKKNKKIQATWTRNCKVLIRLNGDTPEQARVLTVRELKDLNLYC